MTCAMHVNVITQNPHARYIEENGFCKRICTKFVPADTTGKWYVTSLILPLYVVGSLIFFFLSRVSTLTRDIDRSIAILSVRTSVRRP